MTGHKDTLETREKKRSNALAQGRDSDLQQRKRQALLGRTFNDEAKRLMSVASGRPVRQLTLDGEFVAEHASNRAAQLFIGELTGKWHIDIQSCCKGTKKTAGGFKWEYAGERGKK